MTPPLYLLYLDRYHQGDPLFQKELAQRFARTRPGEPPALILHTAGEKLERTLEAEGLFPERDAGGVVQPETPRQAALAERAAREANQEIVALFTEEEVSVVGLQGADRGLLHSGATSSEEGSEDGSQDGSVTAGALGWVEDLVKMRVVPVVSALAEGPERAEAVAPDRAALALAEALESFAVTFCFLVKGDRLRDPLSADALPGDDVLPEPAVVRRVADANARRDDGGRVVLTDLDGFFADDGPRGAQVRAE
ncbi:MAG: acetylglutamate kinase [Bacteroidetes bacterium QH_8_67_23]|nr:MAG: acetylglutamate kinase [Bacteroidetes bacterium QH_8_67_23]